MKRFLPIVILMAFFVIVSLSVKAQNNQIVTNGDTTNTVKFSGTTCTYDWINNNPAIGLAASGSGNIPSFTAINTGSSPVTATISAIPFNGEFAYIANNGDNTVSVINTVNNLIVADLTGFSLPYGVVVSPDNSKVYITNIGAGGFISVLSTANNTLLFKIPVEQQVTGIAISPDGSRLYASENVGAIAVINTTTNAVIATIAADDPLGLVVSPEGVRLYETNPNSGNLTILNTATDDIIATIPVGTYPTDVTLSHDGSIAYVAVENSNYIAVVNTASDAIVSKIPVGIAPFGVVLNNAGTFLYVTNSNSGTVSVINTTNNTVVNNINVGTQPQGISITPDDSQLYVTNSKSNNVSVISTASNTVTATLPVGAYPLSLGSFITQNINCNSGPVTFTITVNPSSQPAIASSGTINASNTVYGTASSPSTFTVSGNNLTAGILVTPPAGFEVSTNGINFSNTITVGSAGAVSSATLYIRLAATTPVNNYSGNVVLSSSNATNVNINIPNSVVTPAALNITANTVHKKYGTTLTDGSGSTAFTSTGLQNNETIGSITISYGVGSQAKAAVGTYSSSVTASLASGGSFNSNNYSITYTRGDIIIDPVPLTIIANNQTKTYGAVNPELTISYTGFVNNDNVSALMPQPIISTTATTASPVGKYPITVSGAGSQDYDITYMSGILTIVPANIELVIPNTFTPNGDGINDTWVINYIEYYPNATVNIFNRYGEKILTSIGYGVPWDGTYKGVNVPAGTYYYIIDTKSGNKPLSGWVAVIR